MRPCSALCCIVSAMLISLGGCTFFNPTDSTTKSIDIQDGNAGTVTYEFNDMGNAGMELFGADTAKVIVTSKSDGKTWVFIINIGTGEETS